MVGINAFIVFHSGLVASQNLEIVRIYVLSAAWPCELLEQKLQQMLILAAFTVHIVLGVCKQ